MSQRVLIGGLTVVMLLTTATTVTLGLKQKKALTLNAELMQRCEALRLESDNTAQALSSLAAQRTADQAELTRLRESSAMTIKALHEQVATLEKQAAAIQDQIRQAQADGSLRESRIAELTAQLAATQESADKAQGQLKAMGFTKDELNDQVGKLQTRLAASQTELEAAREANREQGQKIITLTSELGTASATIEASRKENVVLARSYLELSDELARRPRVSANPDGDTYKPTRDRKAKK